MSTDEVFGDVPERFCREDDVLAPRNPYSASKAAAEMYCNAYHHSYGLPIIVARCYDKKTRAITENGLKTYNELKVGDMVFVRDGNNLKLEPINNIYIYSYLGDMIKFKTGTINLFVTPNHRIICKPRNNDSFLGRQARNYQIKTASEFLNITKYERYHLPKTAVWQGIDDEQIDLSQFVDFENLHRNTKPIKQFVKTTSLLSLFGWYISEGSPSGGGIEIGNKNTENKREIEGLIKEFGVNFINFTKRNGVGCSSVLLKKLLALSGLGAQNKHIPNILLQYSPSKLIFLYNALIKGDGVVTQYGTDVYYTKSPKLVEDMIELALKLGYSPRIAERETWNPKKTKKSKSYIIRMSKTANDGSVEGRHISTELYEGQVWCVSTPSGNLFVEREGCVINCGNSMNMFGEYQNPEKLISKLISKCLTDTHFTLYEGNSIRGWIYVKDTCSALDLLSEKGKIGEIYHIPPDIYLTVSEIAEKILDYTEKRHLFDGYKGKRLKDDERYALDATKFTYGLKWSPKIGFEQGLHNTIEWFAQNKWYWSTLYY